MVVSPTVVSRVWKSGAAVIVTSRTLLASNRWVRPSALRKTRSPVVAMTSFRSVMTVNRTNELDGVTNGSPWFGRSNGVSRLTHGSQR